MSLKAGRQPAYVKRFISPLLPQGWKCNLCGHSTGGKQWAATVWANHICFKCPKATSEQKDEVAKPQHREDQRPIHAVRVAAPRQ